MAAQRRSAANPQRQSASDHGNGGSKPLATVYSGHQFGVWAGQLGDGRAILLGETEQGFEVQLKGAGRTPIHAWATAGPCCARRFANFSAAKPWQPWAFPPRARWR
jgi:hypothetical protein